MSEDARLNVHIHPPSEKTEFLTCNWCKEPHAVEPSYKETFIKRTEEKLRELVEAHPEAECISIDEAWPCGRCMLAMMGKEPDFVRTDCHEHDVPEEAEIGGQIQKLSDMR